MSGQAKQRDSLKQLCSPLQGVAEQPSVATTGKSYAASQCSAYPLDLSSLLMASDDALDEAGVPYARLVDARQAGYHPTTIAQYALAHWNAYLATADEQHQRAFITQARWLAAHEAPGAPDAGGWLTPFPLPAYYASRTCLSALTQGNALSVLVRAYRVTGEASFLDAARRAARTFALDILDGGVSTPIGDTGVFFEEVAVYPAAHTLSGFMQALIGLSEYAAVSGDADIEALIQRALATLDALMNVFDTGYWSRGDLLTRRLASPSLHARHVALLEALARSSGSPHWAGLARRWDGYRKGLRSRLRLRMAQAVERFAIAGQGWLQRVFSPAPAHAEPSSAALMCVPITAFPFAGGMRSVLAGVAATMHDEWDLEYLTWRSGPQSEGLALRTFEGRYSAYWQFPNVWLYLFSGWRRLISLLHRGQRYQVIFPQDGLYTGAFAALAAKLAGVRVVCMDHGTITLPYSAAYRAERMNMLLAQPWHSRFVSRLRLSWYWPSMRLLARIATRYTDCFLAAGEDVAEAYRQHLGVDPSRIMRFPFRVDADRYNPPEAATKTGLREAHGFAADAIIITMINRLAPEKGIDIALRGVSQAMQMLPRDARMKVRLVIAGDGPLRAQVEADLRQYGLTAICTLWGEATPDQVVTLLHISDVFLYTGIRAINSMAVLEAMAAGLAVIASTAPRSLAEVLAEGRGLALPVGDAQAVSAALIQAINDVPRRRQMGRLAREYILAHHSAAALRRCLLRATYWPLNQAHGASEGV